MSDLFPKRQRTQPKMKKSSPLKSSYVPRKENPLDGPPINGLYEDLSHEELLEYYAYLDRLEEMKRSGNYYYIPAVKFPKDIREYTPMFDCFIPSSLPRSRSPSPVRRSNFDRIINDWNKDLVGETEIWKKDYASLIIAVFILLMALVFYS